MNKFLAASAFFLLAGCTTASIPPTADITLAAPKRAALPATTAPEGATVIRVIDGDTVRVRLDGVGTEEIVRLIGIDTPEIDWKKRKIACFASEALARATELLQGKQVSLHAKPEEDRDGYKRLLRYVHAGGEDIGARLLLEGYARNFPWFPHPRLDRYAAFDREARQANTGLWGACREEDSE